MASLPSRQPGAGGARGMHRRGLIHVGLGGRREVLSWISIFIFVIFYHSLWDGRKALHLFCRSSSSSSRFFWPPTESGCLPRAALPARRRNWVTEMVGSASRDGRKKQKPQPKIINNNTLTTHLGKSMMLVSVGAWFTFSFFSANCFFLILWFLIKLRRMIHLVFTD